MFQWKKVRKGAQTVQCHGDAVSCFRTSCCNLDVYKSVICFFLRFSVQFVEMVADRLARCGYKGQADPKSPVSVHAV